MSSGKSLLKNCWTRTRFFLQYCAFGLVIDVLRGDLCFAMVDDSMNSRGTTAPALSALSAIRRPPAATAAPCQGRKWGARIAAWLRVNLRNDDVASTTLADCSADSLLSISRNTLFRRFLAAVAGRLNLSTIFRTRTFGVCGTQRGRSYPAAGQQRLPVFVCSSGSLRLVEVSVRQ